MYWFSGRLVHNIDTNDENQTDEQMSFGFSTGDKKIPRPYFYAIAYPTPHGFIGSTLP